MVFMLLLNRIPVDCNLSLHLISRSLVIMNVFMFASEGEDATTSYKDV